MGMAITAFPSALFFFPSQSQDLSNVSFWLIKASRINSTFFCQIAWMFRASRLLKGRKDSFLPAGQVYALGLSSLGGKLAMPCSRCGGSAPGPSLFLLSLGGRVMSSTILSSRFHPHSLTHSTVQTQCPRNAFTPWRIFITSPACLSVSS